MRRYGDFEAADLVSQTGLVTVWAARKPPGTASLYAIKTLDPHESLPDPERFERQRNRFLGGAAVQERLTRAGALFWAPVYQQGKTDQGAFYVTDRFEQSLQYLIDGQVRLSGETLGMIVMSISSGLLELRQVCNRPHGNLKPTNILVRRRHVSALANLALTDPLADESIQPHHRAADLRRLGELIYVLAAGRPAPENPGWQVPAEEKWSHLGAGWRKWKFLCNLLLKAPAKPDGIRLEGVLRMAARLQKAPRVARRVTIAVCCVVLCTIASGVCYVRFRKAKPDDWWTVCAENISWIENLAANTKNIRLADWGPIKDVIAKASTHEDAWSLPVLSKTTGKRAEAVGKLQKNIDILRGYLTPGSPTQKDGWELLNEINITAQILPAESPLAKAMDSIVSAIRPPDAREIEDILTETKGIYKPAEDKINALREKHTNIGPNIRCIVENRKELETLCGDISNLNKSIGKLKEAGGVEAGRVFTLIADRSMDKFNALASNIAETISGNPLTIRKGFKQRTEEFSQFLGDVDRLESLSNNISLDKKSLMDEWRGKVDPISDFRKFTEKIMAYAETDGEWLIKQQAKTFNDSDALKEHWKFLLDGFKGQMDRNTSNASLFEHRVKIENDYKGLVRIDDKRKQITDILPQALDQRWADLSVLHKQAIEDVLKKIPQDNIATIDPNNISEMDSLTKVSKQLKELIDTFQILRNDLEQVRLLSDEKISEAVIKYQTSRLALKHPDIQTYVFGPTSSLNKDFLTLDTRIELQKGIGNKQKQELIDLINSREFIECRYAAWLQLGKFDPPWPNAKEWDTENKAFNALLAEFTLKQNLNPDTLTKLKTEGNRRIKVYHQNRADALNNEWTTLYDIVKTQGTVVEDHGTLIKGSIYPGLSEFLNIFRTKIDQYSATAKIETWDQLDRSKLSMKLDESMKDPNSILPSAKRLKEFLQSSNWNDTATYNRDLFMRDEVKKEDSNILQWPQTLINQYAQYKKLSIDFWSEVEIKLKALYGDIQKEKPNNKAGEEHAKDAEKKLKNYINKVNNNNKYDNHYELIVKNRDYLAGKRDDLDMRIVYIRDMLRPEFCRNLKLEGDKVVFDIPALSQFEPILFTGPDETLPWVQKKDMWLSLGPRAWNLIKEQDGTKELKSQIDQWQASTGNLIPEDKEKARWISMKDINTQTLHEMFFWKFTGNVKELHWPKYIRSIKDSTVILRYIPAGPNTNHFYMSVREITAGQYVKFLNSEKRYPSSDAWGDTLRIETWIDWKSDTRHLPLPIMLATNPSSDKQFLEQKGYAERPMTYLTYEGAQAYAKWLAGDKGDIPKESQHRFACNPQNNRLLPWTDDSDITLYANIGGSLWKEDIDNYNRQKESRTVSEPHGIICPKGFESPQEFTVDLYSIDQQPIFVLSEPLQREQGSLMCYPRNTISKGNTYGLHDMIGNAWEWCIDENPQAGNICGFSCLTPKSLIEDPDKYYCLRTNTPLPENYALTLKSESGSTKEAMITPDYDIGFRMVINFP